MSDNTQFDVVFLGAGLSNGLIAAALLHHCPSARVAVIDQNTTLQSEKTWCFHDTDVKHVSAAWAWLRPFVAHQWSHYDVLFPSYTRRFDGAYNCITGDRFGEVLKAKLSPPNVRQFLSSSAQVQRDVVVLQNGLRLDAGVVFDGRGAAWPEGCGFQKFVGWEIEVAPGASALPTAPILMDATVEQVDGYRFVYVLPLGAGRLLVEDTYFSSSHILDVATLEGRLRGYVASQGWQLVRVVRVEKGVLPMPWSEQKPTPHASEENVFDVGYRGGWFQPATGYSMPMAVSVAQAVALGISDGIKYSQPLVTAVARALAPLQSAFGNRIRFYRMLNRLAFKAVADDDRRAVFERFYKLPAGLVGRFYAGRSTWLDRARILGGRPPVPLSKFRLGRLLEGAS